MRMMLAAFSALFITASLAQASPPKLQNSCIFVRDTWTWKAADARTMYSKVFPNRYFRLELAGQCPELLWPNAQLITVNRGSTSICTALDWDLQVKSGARGAPVPCIVKRMTGLSAQEAAQIPEKYKPR